MPTDLRHDIDYLEQLLKQSIRLRNTARSSEEFDMLTSVKDYIVCLTLDAIKDFDLAMELVKSFFILQGWLVQFSHETNEYNSTSYYLGFLCGLERLLSIWHKIDISPLGGATSREDFKSRWKIYEMYESWCIKLKESDRVAWTQLRSVPNKPGAYAIWLEKEGKCLPLKVGIAGPTRKDGLRGRLNYHYKSNLENSVLARHMSADLELATEFGYDFEQKWERQKFLDAYCFFKFIVLENLGNNELKSFECYLESKLQPRYKGKVGGPYPPIEFESCP